MRLYVWQPNGHGSLSFFVMAENKEEARAAVDSVVSKNPDAYEYSGWGTDYYELTIYDAGDVATNDNT